MKNNQILTLLGFAAKAGKLSFGTHATEWAITVGKARLIVIAEDISGKTVKEIRFKADKKNIPVLVLEGIGSEELSHRVGKSCGIIAVCDTGFADAVNKYFKEETRYDGEI